MQPGAKPPLHNMGSSFVIAYDPWLQAKFNYWLEYVGEDVGLVWRHDSGMCKAGDVAGHVDALGARIFKLTYQGYSVASAIICMVDGWYPKRVKFLDGNKRNFRRENLCPSIPKPVRVTPDMLFKNSTLHKLFVVKDEMLYERKTQLLAIDHIRDFAYVIVDGVKAKIQNVLFQMVHGKFPPSRLYPLDYNKLNTRVSNWTTVKPIIMPSEYPCVRYFKNLNGWRAEGAKPLYATDIVAFVAHLKERRAKGLPDLPQYSHIYDAYGSFLSSPRPIPHKITLPRFAHYRPPQVSLQLTRSAMKT